MDGYRDRSVMMSNQKGAVSTLQKHLSNAVKCPCYSHSLNLSISKSVEVREVRNAVGIIKETINFFDASSKRNKVIQFTNNDQLKKLCETRWTQRHESVLIFKISFKNIIASLELITQWKDQQSSSKADTILSSLLNSKFICSLYCLAYVLSFTVNLSNIFQKKKTLTKAKLGS